jgi:flagellar motor switch protein FliG
MPDTSNALRKAAILIDSLDAAGADALLEQMGEQQASRVRAAVLDLDDVTQAERDEVIAAFLGGRQQSEPAADEGVELDESLTSKFAAPDAPGASARGHETARSTAPRDDDEGVRPFAFLHEATPKSLASLLTNEHPQTAALVVAHVSPTLAADVLKSLPAVMQVEVLRRIVDLEEADPEILREVERQMEAMLSDELRANRRRQQGMVAVGAILAAAGGQGRQTLLTNLASIDASLASRFDEVAEQTAVVSTGRRWRRQLKENETSPSSGGALDEQQPQKRRTFWRRARPVEETPRASSSPSTTSQSAATTKKTPAESSRRPAPLSKPAATETPVVTFEELMQLDDGALVSVVNAAAPELTLLALTGAPQRLIARIARQLPRQEALSLQRRTQQTGPVRLSDIEEARRQLAALAGRMAQRGEIRLSASRRFAVSV